MTETTFTITALVCTAIACSALALIYRVSQMRARQRDRAIIRARLASIYRAARHQ